MIPVGGSPLDCFSGNEQFINETCDIMNFIKCKELKKFEIKSKSLNI